MKRSFCAVVLLSMLWMPFGPALYAQETTSITVTYKNLPVRYTAGGRTLQQVLAIYTAEKEGTAVFSVDGKEVRSANFKKGKNQFVLEVGAVEEPKTIRISARLDPPSAVLESSLTLTPPRRWQVYFVQHSHTDIGYTRPQSEILAEHMRYIDYALDYCDQTDSLPDDARFRWTCESAWVTREYLRSRPASQVERLKKRIREGRVEVTGMYCNMAETADENLMVDFLQPLREFERQEIPVQTAMQNDVNGIAWCLPDYFKGTGVKYLDMGINETRSILPFDQPTCFWWESPSGARLLAFRADHYHTGNFYGLVSEPFKPEAMLEHLADLESGKYPFDRIAIQYSGYWTDNAPPSTAACQVVREWNARYEFPKLRLAVAREFFEYVEQNHGSRLPVHRQAWLDWWTDGAGSTSRETAEIRKTQNLIQVDEGLFAMISALGGELGPALENRLDHINENAIFFDEHTFGADESISRPFSENTTRQWLQKGAYAWEALKKVTLLHEEALARFQDFLPKATHPLIYVINSMGWKRSGHIELFIDNQVMPVEKKCRILDMAGGKEVPAQLIGKRREGAYWVLEVEDIPALGFKALKIEVLGDAPSEADRAAPDEALILENRYYRLSMDKVTGAVSSLRDKELNLELADSSNPWKIGQLVHETLPKRDQMKPSHTTVSNVKVEQGTRGPVWDSLRVSADLAGFEGTSGKDPAGIELEIRLFRQAKKVEFHYSARKQIRVDPEATYVAFPFSLPEGQIVFETIGGILAQGQQLPGSSSDWNVAQSFVAVRGRNAQIILTSNEIPLWHFSDFNMGKFERHPRPGKPWLFSWVMNNYWFTNFRAFQEGGFRWSYQLTSSADTTNGTATRWAWNERNPFPTRTFPAGRSEAPAPVLETLQIQLPPNILLANSRPAFPKKSAVLLRFRELEGKPGEIRVGSRIPGKPVRSVSETNSLGKLLASSGTSIAMKPFEVKFIEVQF